MRLRRPHKLSPRGGHFIGTFEGFLEAPSDKLDGCCTIGYGHVLHFSRCTPADNRLRWSRRKAARVLTADAQRVADHVRQVITAWLSQPQFDALVSVGYNLGPGYVDKLVPIINRHRGSRLHGIRSVSCKRQVAEALRQWDHSDGIVLAGLTRRRNAEAELFRTGEYRNRFTT